VAQLDLTEFLNQTYYFFDFYCAGLVVDVRDSLIFSEDNIHAKFCDAVHALNKKTLSPDVYEHDLEQITLRFKINLAMNARYSALVSFVTGVAWCAEYFATHVKDPLQAKADCFGL
jgi:hypothetical protein